MKTVHLMGLVVAAVLVLVWAPRPAAAGGCTECTTSQECVDALGPGSLCVLWTHDVGCGAIVQMCCPGQGCAIDMNGRPSCEMSGDCTVVENLPDAAPGTIDANPNAPDADPNAPDAGPGGNDSGSCRVAAGAPASGAGGLGVLLVVGALIGWRRRR